MGLETLNPQDAIEQMTQAAAMTQQQQPPAAAAPPQPDPNAAAAPQDDPNAMAHPNTIEAVAAGVHHSRLARTLDAVGNLLGGDKTIHITKKADGTVEVTHDPSTGGEKWGRVAQAALGGLAQGFAAGPGPGGFGRAAAGGIQSGLQLPQQREDQATQTANQENETSQKQQLFSANMAALNQRSVMNADEMRRANVVFTNEQMDRQNAIHQAMVNAPGSEDLGSFEGAKDLPSFTAKYPHALDAHTGQNDKAVLFYPEFDGSGKQTGSRVVLMSKPMAERLMPDPPPLSQDYYDPKTKSIQTKPVDVSKMGMTFGQYAQASQKLMNDNSELALKVSKETRDTANEGRQERLTEAQIGREHAQAAEANAKATATRHLLDISAGGQYGPLGEDIYKGKADISQIRTRKDWPEMYAAARQYGIDNGLPPLDLATAGAKYKARVKAYGDYSGNGAAATKIQGFSTLLEHLGDMSDNADELRNTGSPWLNKPINDLDKTILGGTKVGPAELRTSAPAHEFANVLSNNRALNNEEKAAAAKSLNTSMTPAQLQGNAKQMARTSIERLAPVFQAFRESANGEESPTQLTPGAIRTLHSLGLYDLYQQEAHGVAQPPPAQPQNASQATRQAGAAPPPPPPKVGDVVQGHVYQGGNPADPANWKAQ